MSCFRTQHSDAGEAQTLGTSVLSHHSTTEPLCSIAWSVCASLGIPTEFRKYKCHRYNKSFKWYISKLLQKKSTLDALVL